MGPGTDAQAEATEVRSFLRRGALFVLVGLTLYGGLFAASEALVQRNALRNRFWAVHSAEPRYDFVLLGASHAAVLDYRDLNAELEALTGARILNLATLGGGIAVNRLLVEYFFEDHQADVVVYVLDSFAFYSTVWNEERLRDSELYQRAPWDPALAGLLLEHGAGWTVVLDYLTGFSKINNPARFDPDSFPAEGSSFERSYRPVPQIDRQRIDFLYPEGADPTGETAQRYMEELERLVSYVREQDASFVVVRPPIPLGWREMIPAEDDFDAVLEDRMAQLDIPYFDFTNALPDQALYHDTDHLNLEGARRFLEEHLAPALRGN